MPIIKTSDTGRPVRNPAGLSSPAERDLRSHGTRILVGILTFLTFAGWWLQTAGVPIGIRALVLFSFLFSVYLASGERTSGSCELGLEFKPQVFVLDSYSRDDAA